MRVAFDVKDPKNDNSAFIAYYQTNIGNDDLKLNWLSKLFQSIFLNLISMSLEQLNNLVMLFTMLNTLQRVFKEQSFWFNLFNTQTNTAFMPQTSGWLKSKKQLKRSLMKILSLSKAQYTLLWLRKTSILQKCMSDLGVKSVLMNTISANNKTRLKPWRLWPKLTSLNVSTIPSSLKTQRELISNLIAKLKKSLSKKT